MLFETVTRMAKSADTSKKSEKSQVELREVLKQKLQSFKPVMEESIKKYEQALKVGVFEDQDGESIGTGEAKKEAWQKKIMMLFDRAEQMKARLESTEALSQVPENLSTTYTHPDGKQETITLNFEAKLADFLSFYQKTGIDIPGDFEDTIRDLWERHRDEVEQAIEANGFDDILLIPGSIPLPELSEKMKMENGYYEGDNFKNGGSFAGAVSENTDKPRIILIHKTQNLKDRPELKKTLNIKGQDVKRDHILTLEDYLIFQRKYFEETGKHLDEDGWTWLSTTSGARLVGSGWDPDNRKLYVDALGLERRAPGLGARPSRCFS